MEFLLPIYFQNCHFCSNIEILRFIAQGFATSPISSFNSTLNSLDSGSWVSEEIFSDLSEIDSKSKLDVIAIAIPIPMAITVIIPAITALFN